jgi:hypothetical protein
MISIVLAAQTCNQKKTRLKGPIAVTFVATELAKSACTRPENLLRHRIEYKLIKTRINNYIKLIQNHWKKRVLLTL